MWLIKLSCWQKDRRLTGRFIAMVSFAVLTTHGALSAVAQTARPTPIPARDVIGLTIATSPAPRYKVSSARIDTSLLTIAEEHRRFVARHPAVSERFQTAVPGARLSTDGYVLVDLVTESPADLSHTLAGWGLRSAAQRGRILSGWLPVSAVSQLASISLVKSARLAVFKRSAGSVTSQGDVALAAASARSTYGVNGTGVVIGTLSDSYNCRGGAAADVASGDLPSNVVVLKDESGSACSSGTDEGRAMMQIEHDLAPGAQLAFYTAAGGTADFANGINALRQTAGATVIVDDALYYAEPMFQDGIIAQAVNAAAQQGVMYFSAAGNQAAQSYESAFRPSGVIGPLTGGERHNFNTSGGVASLQPVSIPVNQTVTIVLQWNDPFFSVSGSPGAATDLDLVLYDTAGNAVAAAATNNIGGDPVEVLSFHNSGPATNYQLGIERFAGPNPSRMKYVWNGQLTPLQYATNSSTIYGHPNAAGGRAVGTANYPNTPAFGVSPPVLAPYSSQGGTALSFDTQGHPISAPRYKPEIVGVDGVDTTFFGTDTNGNGFPNFYGTSAAAPHAAAVAALLVQVAPTATLTQKFQALEESALDMGAPGFDYQSGVGLIQAPAALAWISSVGGTGEVGFSSLTDGTPTQGAIATNAYASQGLTLQVSGRSDGFATLSPPPTGGTVGGFSGSSLEATGAAGAASITLSFPPTVTQVNFAFATASGQIRATMLNANGQTLGTQTFSGSTAIAFPGASLKGGTAALSSLGGIAQVVVTTLSPDTDLRIDALSYGPIGAAAVGTPSDAPLPEWSLGVLALALFAIVATRRQAKPGLSSEKRI